MSDRVNTRNAVPHATARIWVEWEDVDVKGEFVLAWFAVRVLHSAPVSEPGDALAFGALFVRF